MKEMVVNHKRFLAAVGLYILLMLILTGINSASNNVTAKNANSLPTAGVATILDK
jgi:hypothetical protein